MSSSATPTTPHAPRPGRYIADPARTTVRFKARHMFGIGRVSGTFALRDAELVVGDPTTASTVHAVLDATSFDTGNARRDTDVRSAKYLDAAAHPDITFSCESVLHRAEHWVASGNVTARGVAAPADVVVREFDDRRDEITLRATAKIDRYAHRVTAGKGLARRWLTLEIATLAVRSPVA